MTFYTGLPLEQLSVRQDYNRHVALEFAQDERTSSYLAYSSDGLCIEQMSAPLFYKKFSSILSSATAHKEQFVLHVVSLLKSVKQAYLPAPRASLILMEILIMAANEGSKDLKTMDLKSLTALYNQLAAAKGMRQIVEFKSKAIALKRLEPLMAELAQPTPKQQEAADKVSEKAKVSKAPATPKVAKVSKAPAAPKVAKVSKAPAAPKVAKVSKAPAAPKVAKPKNGVEPAGRGKGIGAFCITLIQKGQDNESILQSVKNQFPGAKTSAASIAWYRNKLRCEAAGL